MHTALDGKLGGGCAGFRRAGAFHQHVEGEARDVFEAVHDDVEAVGVSLLRILGGFAHADLGGGDARVFIGAWKRKDAPNSPAPVRQALTGRWMDGLNSDS